MKREIKYLLESWLQAKNQNAAMAKLNSNMAHPNVKLSNAS